MRILTQTRKEKSNLCFSNSERQTLQYRLKVKYSLMWTMRSSRSSAGGEGRERK